MASHQELMVEWTMLDNDCNNWTLQDLQLAAELGRTLLERNEELENELKQQQAIIDDQAQEIEFLTKQSSSMKEESATRAKFYEQLESSIYELERTNSQLSRKHEIDKKRIQSLLENIEFLERKCEEIAISLETIRDQNKKSYGGSKMSRSSYFSFGGGSSDDEIHTGFPLYRRRSHSLHDLRDYSSSPDDFDSNNSNSPDLKTSEAEFIETLESRIEELLSAKRKECEKIQQLESQMRILIQENATLQQQLSELTTEKDEEIAELRKQLLDSSSYTQLPFPMISESMLSCATTLPFKTSSRRNSMSATTSYLAAPSASASLSNPSLRSFVSLCKRCSTEINILNLVNSIEDEHDSENYENFLSYDNDDDMEFSSLEHELARATGNAFDNHNSHNNLRHLLMQQNSYHHHHQHLHNHHHHHSLPYTQHDPHCTDVDTLSSSNDDKDEVGVEAKEIPDENKISCSSDEEEEEEEEDEEEDPCLLKDRKQEFVVKTKAKTKNKIKHSSSSSAKKFKSSDSCCGSSTSSGCSSAAATYSSTGHCTSRQSSPVVMVVKNSKLLELPLRIPTDDEGDNDDDDECHNSIVIAEKKSIHLESTAAVAAAVAHGLKHRKGCDSIDGDGDGDGSRGVVDAMSSKLLEVDETNQEADKEQANALKKRSKLFHAQESTSSSSGYDSESSVTKSGDCNATLSSSSSSASISGSMSAEEEVVTVTVSSKASSASIVPEYKEILQNMFSLFNNSKRKYPMYPFIQEARRQSSALTQ